MSKPILGPLYLLELSAWNFALAHLDSDYYMARFVVSPGYVIGRPAWPRDEDKRKWLAATQAIKVDPVELNDETRTKLGTYELMLA